MPSIQTTIARELNLTAAQVAAVIDLVDQGNTIPFIARYRKEATGAMDDQLLRRLADRLQYLRGLAARKEEVRAAVEGQGKLTEDLSAALDAAATLAEVEDLYRPYKQKRRTRATIAREKGLEPLVRLLSAQGPAVDPRQAALDFLDPDKGVETAEDALQGASDILAEEISDRADLRKELRQLYLRRGVLTSKAADKEPEDSVYRLYYDFKCPVSRVQGYQTLAINRGEREKLLHLEDILHQRVIGQDEAVQKVTEAILRSRAGIADPNRPIGSFLFLGPTGVGKTELAKTLAEYLFDSEKAMVRIDMSEYMEKFSVQRLIGAPPGYVGYDEGGQLTEAVRRNPYCVVLLDEMEKAHPDVFNILLQVLDDGRLTDGQGRVVNFKNCIIIMTSNVGSQIIREHAAEGRAYDEAQATGGETMGEMAEKMMSMTPEQAAKRMQEFTNKIQDALSTTFRPEFLNRIDDVITFNELSISAIEPIVDLQLEQVRDRLQARHITLDVTPAAMEHLAIDGYDPVYGARPLKRLIQREVVDRIAERVITGELRDRSHVLIDLDAEGNYCCRVEGPMDLDGLNLDDPSFLTAGADPKETLQDLDTLSNGDLGEDPIA